MADYIDLTNQRFGKLLVIKKSHGRYTSGNQFKSTWKCQCDCGKLVEVDSEKLRKGHTTSCGCEKRNNKGSRFQDLSGKKFGRLEVIRFIPINERESRRKSWLCKCDCGNFTQVDPVKLNTGHTSSCGCLKQEYKDIIKNLNRKYNCTNKRLQSVYFAMLDRCYNKNNRSYHNYGGRGIFVCDEWKSDFDAFAKWAFSHGYKAHAKRGECTLDRKNVNEAYCPDNCCWISNKQQQNNKRVCQKIEYKGETHTIAEWADIFNIPYSTLYNGIKRYGKSIEDYISE